MDEPWKPPKAQGLYDPSYEKSACGVGFIVNIDGTPSQKVVRDAETLSSRMKHRGAQSADNDTGDGAGLCAAIPDTFYRKILGEVGISLPEKGKYATGIFFFNADSHEKLEAKFEKLAMEYEFKVLHWRTVPTNDSMIGEVARETEPLMRQVFLTPLKEMQNEQFKLKVFTLRKIASHTLPEPGIRFYICSLSSTTVVYKGQLTSDQLWNYFEDLSNEHFETYLALVHTRFSTNTFPSWERAHPLRLLAHNGEINTLRGNVNLMKAREGIMKSSIFGDELQKLYPVVEPNLSDSGAVDCCLEFLVMVGRRSLPEAMITMVPEAWQNDQLMHPEKKDFYRWAACAMEPWDGPALMTFTDGRYVGAILDRNGLRPSRYYVTKDRFMVMASEVGVYDTEPENILQKGRLKPGRMLLVDTQEKVIMKDEEVKLQIARARPHSEWIKEQYRMKDIYNFAKTINRELSFETLIHQPVKEHSGHIENIDEEVIRDVLVADKRLSMFGYTQETLTMLILPMVLTKKEALGSMGNDAPHACLSEFQPIIYDYFKQLFAQVTNPPIDPFREKIVMSMACPIGPEYNILEPSADQCKRLYLEDPIISLKGLEVFRNVKHPYWKAKVIDITYPCNEGWQGLPKALDRISQEARKAAEEHFRLIILSDRGAGPKRVAVSVLLALGCTHHYLINTRQRTKVALILETGEAREVHHLCVLLGYGADAICPYLVLETMRSFKNKGIIPREFDDYTIFKNYSAATETGICKVMAKMGISTLQSYKCAQIFEAVGLSVEVIDKCFIGTASRLGGMSFKEIGLETLERHKMTYGLHECDSHILRNPGFYHWRSGGEKHINDPDTLAHLQEAGRSNSKNDYQKFSASALQSVKACTLRGQFDLIYSNKPIDISEVEPAANIVKRFVTGAMSFGSISLEAHSTLAIAMNRVGAKSNTGEGGEDPDRYLNQDPQNNQRSSIKQVASGRFGVTASYLAHADELQIKMAQGAKPGEGGELPGHKVSKEIAKTRHSVPGVGLISPPPHHDIYSIEDLAELIYDLKASNPRARISVKLVSEVGVGVIASGVAKGKAEHITISGHDGGTGASSWTGIKNAGLPWELGIAETHQTLTLNNLRSRVVLQADGQIRCGFDVILAAILGADEFGFSTAPLIVMGCTMMRKCHLNTCPVGIATQDPVLRKKFEGKPEHVVNYLFLLAEEIREHLAKLGAHSMQEIIGKTDLIKAREDVTPKIKCLDFSKIFKSALEMRPGTNIVGGSVTQDFNLPQRLSNELLGLCKQILDGTKNTVTIEMPIKSDQRAFGSTLSYHISLMCDDGLPEGKLIKMYLKGSAGQSFCGFLCKGIQVTLEGDANDYVCKGLSGGEVVIYPEKNISSDFKSEDNIIVGNVCLYGATSGTAFFRGQAAERFCVRNSGATAVVEGTGDHACEYMTGGKALILGATGRNFAAGMSGGIAYVYDIKNDFAKKCNPEMVELCALEQQEDLNFVKKLLERFHESTSSQRAKDILDNWSESVKKFVKVFPYEYQRALKEMEQEKIVELNENSTEVAPTGEQLAINSHMLDIEDSIQDAEREKKKLEIVLDKSRGFVKYKRNTVSYRNAVNRQKDWNEIYDFQGVRKSIKMQAARCMECGVPFCQSDHGCPLGNIIPKWNDLVFQDNWKEALHQLLQTNNFPEFTGRVCPAPCEGACVLGINELPVTIKNIECAIIDNAFEEGWIVPQPPPQRTGKKVAVIGSGPAGLAAAHQLNKAGHAVTVYERNDRIGGLLQYGIPTMKLGKDVVQRRVKLMEDEGIVFITNSNVGKDISLQDLNDKYDAIVLCMGATWPRDLNIPGRELEGIEFAMSFLETWQKKQMGNTSSDHPRIIAKDKNVIVIGGGDTGCDCIATSLRQGANSITTFEILPQPPPSRGKDNPWPTFPRVFKVDYGHEEVQMKFGKDPRQYSTLTKEFIGENGKLTGVRTVEVEWNKDDKGRWQMKELEGTEELLKAELVLLAMGFLGPEKYATEKLKIDLDTRSNIKTENGCYATSIEKFFAAGDCRRGQSLVVWAITEGRLAAREVDLYLMGTTSLPGMGGVIQFKYD